jgi:hypothetical protein
MTTKTTNILYWASTALFSLLMIFSAVGGIQPSQQAIDLIHGQLGYPIYFIPFISVAKIVGSIAILIPALKRAKEWAYAGLLFDLVAATYSAVAANGFDPMMLSLAIWFVPGIVSYILWQKRTNG